MRTEQTRSDLLQEGASFSAPEKQAPLGFGDSGRQPNVGFSRILVPVDFSETSQMAVEMARSLVKSEGGALWLLHVIEPAPLMSNVDGMVLAKSDVEMRDYTIRKLERLRRQLSTPGVGIVMLVRKGQAAVEICRAARFLEVDLVLLGRHKHGLLDRLLSRSTAHDVLRHACCPVFFLAECGMSGDEPGEPGEAE